MDDLVNASQDWYDEIEFWDFENCKKKKGFENEMVGHFTALVWGWSTKVGFGRARSKDGNKLYMVAQYHPGESKLKLN